MLDTHALQRHPLLIDAAPQTLALLSSRAARKEWRPRQVLFRRGQPPVGLILVLDGRVRVVRETNGRRQILHIEGAGGTLGEVPLFDGQTMPATAIAAEATTGILIVPDLLQLAIRADPELANKLLARLASRVRLLADRLERLTQHSVARRLAAVLLQLAGNQLDQPFGLGMPQDQFAEELGTVREVLVRELAVLVRRGVLTSLGRGRFLVRDRAFLENTAISQL